MYLYSIYMNLFFVNIFLFYYRESLMALSHRVVQMQLYRVSRR